MSRAENFHIAILTAVIFSLLVVQECINMLICIAMVSRTTVSVGVPTFRVHGDVYNWGVLMVGCLIGSLPIVIIYSFFVSDL
jgi:multiple sugar transport system permease protein